MNSFRSISKIKLFFLFLFLLCNSFSCKKDDYSEVPYAYTDITLNVYNELSTVGIGQFVIIYPSTTPGQIRMVDPFSGAQYNIGGNFTGKGLILYRYNMDEWNAYDITCTYIPKPANAAVQVWNDSLFAVCQSCKSRFLIHDGSPQSGILATRALKRYNAILEPHGNLYITN